MTTRAKVVNAALVAVAIAGGVLAYETVGPTSQARARVQTATVVRGTVLSTVSASGNVQAPAAYTLSFKSGGTLTALPAKLGQRVRAGQALAKVDATSAQASVRTARAGLISAQANLQSVEQGLTPEQLRQNDISVQQAQLSLSNAKAALAQTLATVALDKKSLAASVAQARASLVQAQQTVRANEAGLQAAADQAKSAVAFTEQSNATSAASAKAAVDQAKTALQLAQASTGQSATGAQATLDQANAQLQTDQTKYNLDVGNLDGIVGASPDAKNSIENAQAAVTNDTQQIQAIQDYQKVNNCTTTCSAPYDAVSLQRLQFRQTADQSVVSSLNQIQTDLQTIAKDQQAIASAQRALGTNGISNEQSLTNARNAYQSAVQSLQKTTVGNEQSLANAKNSYASALQSLQKAKISDAQTLANARSQVTTALANLRSGTLKDAQSVQNARSSVANSQLSLASTTVANEIKAAPATASALAQAQASVANAQVSLLNAQTTLAQTTLRAPAAGTVTAINGTVGQDASSTAGSSSGSGSSSSSSGLITLTNLDTLQVKAGFGETDAAKIKVGQPATVQVSALPNVELAAHVIAVDSTSTVVSNVVTYYATFQLDNKEAALKPGMTVTVSVIVGKRDGVLHVPNAAVRGSGTAGQVTVVDAKGAEQSVRVVTGLQGDESTEIVSGLTQGQQVVVTTGTATLSTGNGGTGRFGGGFGLRGGLGG